MKEASEAVAKSRSPRRSKSQFDQLLAVKHGLINNLKQEYEEIQDLLREAKALRQETYLLYPQLPQQQQIEEKTGTIAKNEFVEGSPAVQGNSKNNQRTSGSLHNDNLSSVSGGAESNKSTEESLEDGEIAFSLIPGTKTQLRTSPKKKMAQDWSNVAFTNQTEEWSSIASDQEQIYFLKIDEKNRRNSSRALQTRQSNIIKNDTKQNKIDLNLDYDADQDNDDDYASEVVELRNTIQQESLANEDKNGRYTTRASQTQPSNIFVNNAKQNKIDRTHEYGAGHDIDDNYAFEIVEPRNTVIQIPQTSKNMKVAYTWGDNLGHEHDHEEVAPNSKHESSEEVKQQYKSIQANMKKLVRLPSENKGPYQADQVSTSKQQQTKEYGVTWNDKASKAIARDEIHAKDVKLVNKNRSHESREKVSSEENESGMDTKETVHHFLREASGEDKKSTGGYPATFKSKRSNPWNAQTKSSNHTNDLDRDKSTAKDNESTQERKITSPLIAETKTESNLLRRGMGPNWGKNECTNENEKKLSCSSSQKYITDHQFAFEAKANEWNQRRKNQIPDKNHESDWHTTSSVKQTVISDFHENTNAEVANAFHGSSTSRNPSYQQVDDPDKEVIFQDEYIRAGKKNKDNTSKLFVMTDQDTLPRQSLLSPKTTKTQIINRVTQEKSLANEDKNGRYTTRSSQTRPSNNYVNDTKQNTIDRTHEYDADHDDDDNYASEIVEPRNTVIQMPQTITTINDTYEWGDNLDHEHDHEEVAPKSKHESSEVKRHYKTIQANMKKLVRLRSENKGPNQADQVSTSKQNQTKEYGVTWNDEASKVIVKDSIRADNFKSGNKNLSHESREKVSREENESGVDTKETAHHLLQKADTPSEASTQGYPATFQRSHGSRFLVPNRFTQSIDDQDEQSDALASIWSDSDTFHSTSASNQPIPSVEDDRRESSSEEEDTNDAFQGYSGVYNDDNDDNAAHKKIPTDQTKKGLEANEKQETKSKKQEKPGKQDLTKQERVEEQKELDHAEQVDQEAKQVTQDPNPSQLNQVTYQLDQHHQEGKHNQLDQHHQEGKQTAEKKTQPQPQPQERVGLGRPATTAWNQPPSKPSPSPAPSPSTPPPLLVPPRTQRLRSQRGGRPLPALLSTETQWLRSFRDAPPLLKYSRLWKAVCQQVIFLLRTRWAVELKRDENRLDADFKHQNLSIRSLLLCVPMFHGLPRAQFEALERTSSLKYFSAGQTLFEIQSEPKTILIVKYGAVSAQNSLSTHLQVFYPGDYLGTINFLHRIPYRYTAIAIGRVECLALDVKVLEELRSHLMDSEALHSEFCKDIQTRERKIELDRTLNLRKWIAEYSKRVLHAVVEKPLEDGAAANGHRSHIHCKFVYQALYMFMSPELDFHEILTRFFYFLCELFQGCAIRIYVWDEKKKELMLKESSDSLSNIRASMSRGLPGRVMAERHMINFLDVDSENNERDSNKKFEKTDGDDTTTAGKAKSSTPSAMACPILQEDKNGEEKVVGVLEIENTSNPKEPFTKHDMEILQAVANGLSHHIVENNISMDFHNFTPISELQSKLQITIHSVMVSLHNAYSNFYVKVSVAHGGEPLCEPKQTQLKKVVPSSRASSQTSSSSKISGSSLQLHQERGKDIDDKGVVVSTQENSIPPEAILVEFNEMFELDVEYANLPQAGRIVFQLYDAKRHQLVAWNQFHLFAAWKHLQTGMFRLQLQSIHSTSKVDWPEIKFSLKEFKRPVQFQLTKSISSRSHMFSTLTKHYISAAASSLTTSELIREGVGINLKSHLRNTTKEQYNRKIELLDQNPFLQFASESEKRWVYEFQSVLWEDRRYLPIFLLSLNHKSAVEVEQGLEMMYQWDRPTFKEALQLLTSRFHNPRIRSFAVSCLETLPDAQLCLYLPQLVQALKLDIFVDSSLTRFLLVRALDNPMEVGATLYWLLKIELSDKSARLRCLGILRVFLDHCSTLLSIELRKTLHVTAAFEHIAAMVRDFSSAKQVDNLLHAEIGELILPEFFQLPLDPTEVYSKVHVMECFVMTSTKKPIIITLDRKNAKAGDAKRSVIFKMGTDLRQEAFCLQILRVLDSLWRSEGNMDLCLTHYRCVALGKQFGIIEYVTEAESLETIMHSKHDASHDASNASHNAAVSPPAAVHHSFFSIFSVFKGSSHKENYLVDWLDSHSNDSSKLPSRRSGSSSQSVVKHESHHLRKKTAREDGEGENKISSRTVKTPASIVDTFAKSLAGYIVFTYLLGIGKSHVPGHILFQRSGRLFHVNLARILRQATAAPASPTKKTLKEEGGDGSSRSKSSASPRGGRGPTPFFVGTHAMLAVLGGEEASPRFPALLRVIAQAFGVARAHGAPLVLALGTLLLPPGQQDGGGITAEGDLHHLADRLFLHESSEGAREHFTAVVQKALLLLDPHHQHHTTTTTTTYK